MTVKLSGYNILNDINLEIEKGEIFCILGKNGAGKSTLLKSILGGVKFQFGEIFIADRKLTPKTRESILSEVGIFFNESISYEHLTVWENIKIVGKLYEVLDSHVYEQTLETVGLLQERDKQVKYLSSGMKQRLGLALAYVHSPKILLLDEPTNALDPQAIVEFRSLIKLLNNRDNISVVYSTHNIDEAQRMSDRIIILKEGIVVFDSKICNIETYKVAVIPKNFKNQSFIDNFDFYEKNDNLHIIYNHETESKLTPFIFSSIVEGATIEDVYLAKHRAIL